MVQDLEDEFLVGVTNYPVNIEVEYNVLNHYKNSIWITTEVKYNSKVLSFTTGIKMINGGKKYKTCINFFNFIRKGITQINYPEKRRDNKWKDPPTLGLGITTTTME